MPVQRERKSGLLFPTIGFNSTNGLLWRQPLYLVLSENRDVTLYLDYQGRKGLGQALEYRYIERYAGEGNLWLYHIRDRQAHRDYFELKAEHRRSGASGLTGFLKLNLINRKDFYSTFSHRVEAWSSRFLQSTAQIALNKRTYQLYIDGRFWQELRQGHQTGEIHQQLPEIGFYYYPERHNPLYISTQVSLVNYHSVELSRVRRLDIYPVFRHSLGKTFRFSQSLGLRGTFYWISNTDQYPDTEQRASFDYNVSLKTLFRREFGRYTHIVEPELFYSFIPETVDDIPSVDGVDSYDRLSLLGLSINNYLYRGPQMLASMRITEPYDFHGGDRPLRPVRLQLRLFEPLDLTSEFSYNTEDGRIDRANITVSKTIRDFSISLSQRYSRDYDILFYNGSVTVPVTRKLNLSGSVWYDAKGEGMKNYRVALSYQSQCWGIKVTYDKRPGDYSLYVLLQFKGLGELKLESFI
ncbi:MAG: LPS-assembly protein LptD [Nitrospirae bacterium]|nr:MAG: LPS-assembly protein LptD [Nitrospirota bacterium]